MNWIVLVEYVVYLQALNVLGYQAPLVGRLLIAVALEPSWGPPWLSRHHRPELQVEREDLHLSVASSLLTYCKKTAVGLQR